MAEKKTITANFDDLLLGKPPVVPVEAPGKRTLPKKKWAPAVLDPQESAFVQALPDDSGEANEIDALTMERDILNPAAVATEVTPEAAKPKADEKPAEPEEPKLYTEEEKLRYVQLTCAGKRFTKAYELFNGEIKVTFRELIPKEDSLVIRQVAMESYRHEQGSEFRGQATYVFMAETYFCLLSIARYENLEGVQDIPPIFDSPAVAAAGAVTEKGTVLDVLAPALSEMVFATSSIQRLILVKYREFRAMMNQLEKHAALGNF